MRSLLKFNILFILLFSIACTVEQKPSMPIDTFKAYTLAFKKKDTTTMKLLMSDASLKMAEQRAREQNVTVDDIVKNETLFTENQKDFFFRNEKIEGDRATIEYKNSFDAWDIVPFVREDGVWKIDKLGIATQMQQQNDFNNKKLDDLINGNSSDVTIDPTSPRNREINPNDPTISPNRTVDPAISPNATASPNNLTSPNETETKSSPKP